MKAIRIEEYGDADVLKFVDVPRPTPAPGQALVRMEAIGVNFIDTYQRSGLYKVDLPYTLGLEGAGIVEAVGPDVDTLTVGDRVAFAGVPGAYAEYVAAPAERLVRLPEGVDALQGAAAMLQGMTAHYLVYDTFRLQSGHACLIHAGAGGVGLLLIQLARRIGAQVFTTVSTQAKAELAREAGADHVILYTKQDFEEEVKHATNGEGVHVVYDSVGRDTFSKSLDCLRVRGYMVLFGQSSGPVAPIDPAILNTKGSLFLTRPSLFHYIADRPSLERRAGDVLRWVASGELKLRIHHKWPLAEAAQAHRMLEARKTTGKVVLIP